MTTAPEPPGQRPAGRSAPQAPWYRVHPLTPYIRSWLLIVAIAWGVSNTFLDDVIDAVVKGEPLDIGVSGAVQLVGAGLVLGVLILVLGLLVGLGWLSWWFTRYQVTAEHVRFRSGMVFRTQRQTRLDRVQGIDIERKFLPRLFGLASLKFDVADGGERGLELSYLTRDKAVRLREDLLVAARRAGERRDAAAHPSPGRVSGPPAPGPGLAGAAAVRPAPWASPGARAGTGRDPGLEGAPPRGHGSREVRAAERLGLLGEQDEIRRVLTVPTARVLLSMVLSWSTLIIAVLLTAAVVAALWDVRSLAVLLPGYLPIAIGTVSTLYRRLEHGWGFTLSEVPVGARIRYGLLNERSSTIPAGRVQALEVTRPLLWRVFGGHRVRVVTAGKGGGDAEGLQSTVLPVGSAAEVTQVLELVLPLAHPPVALVRAGLDGIGDGAGFRTSPRRARWLDPLTWRRTGYAMDGSALVLRRGRLNRGASVIPHHKTQSLAWQQGPLDRRLGLASLTAHVTPGPVDTSIHHLDAREASELQARQAELARAARARDAAGSGETAPEG